VVLVIPVVDRASEVDDAENEEQQERHHKGELNQRLPVFGATQDAHGPSHAVAPVIP